MEEGEFWLLDAGVKARLDRLTHNGRRGTVNNHAEPTIVTVRDARLINRLRPQQGIESFTITQRARCK